MLCSKKILQKLKRIGRCFVAFGFYAKIGSEKNSFDIADVINSLNEETHFPSSSHLWKCRSERRRRSETKLGKTEAERRKQVYFSRSSEKLPPIIKAYRIQEKIKGIGFEFASAEDAWKK